VDFPKKNYWHILQKICDKIVIKDPTTLKISRYFAKFICSKIALMEAQQLSANKTKKIVLCK